MLARDFPASFAWRGALKDADFLLDLAAASGVELAVTQGVHSHLARAVELGHGAEDMAATWHAHSGT